MWHYIKSRPSIILITDQRSRSPPSGFSIRTAPLWFRSSNHKNKIIIIKELHWIRGLNFASLSLLRLLPLKRKTTATAGSNWIQFSRLHSRLFYFLFSVNLIWKKYIVCINFLALVHVHLYIYNNTNSNKPRLNFNFDVFSIWLCGGGSSYFNFGKYGVVSVVELFIKRWNSVDEVLMIVWRIFEASLRPFKTERPPTFSGINHLRPSFTLFLPFAFTHCCFVSLLKSMLLCRVFWFFGIDWFWGIGLFLCFVVEFFFF